MKPLSASVLHVGGSSRRMRFEGEKIINNCHVDESFHALCMKGFEILSWGFAGAIWRHGCTHIMSHSTTLTTAVWNHWEGTSF